jgi:hypothetical protein
MTDISRRAIIKATGAVGATILPIATATDHAAAQAQAQAQAQDNRPSSF